VPKAAPLAVPIKILSLLELLSLLFNKLPPAPLPIA